MSEFSEMLAPQEKIGHLPQWDSGHKSVALSTLDKVMRRRIRLVHPETSVASIKDQVLQKREKLRVWLDAIDREAVNNFGVFESEQNPGVRFPFTKIRVGNVASSAQNSPINPEAEKLPRKTVVVFTPFIPPPGGGPDDIMNTIYDRVLTALPDIAQRDTHKAKNITVYGLGLPTGKWGSVSEEWLSDLKKHGFSEYGKLYAEHLRTVLGEGNILFFAGSMGTILASETAKQLPEHWENLRLLLNNPAGVHKPTHLPVKGLQVVGGFGAKAGIRMYLPFVDNVVKTSMSGVKQAREALSMVLQQKGMMSYESDEQNALKKTANGQAIKFLIKGTPLDTDNFRSYIEQGMLDPAITDPKKIFFLMTHSKDKRFFKAGERSLGMGVNYSHWMDPGRWPDKWVRGIERYEKLVNAQMRVY